MLANIFFPLTLLIASSHGFFVDLSVSSRPFQNSEQIEIAPGSWSPQNRLSSPLFLSSSDVDDEDDEEVEPGKMRVSEIKAELDMRGVNYKDCFDKESLVERLSDARASGVANPELIDKFNRQRLEDTLNEEKFDVKSENLQDAVANDGTLPGGMTPEMFTKLVEDPEVMEVLQSTKMQEAMKFMMSGDQAGLEELLKSDPELGQMLMKINSAVQGAQE